MKRFTNKQNMVKWNNAGNFSDLYTNKKFVMDEIKEIPVKESPGVAFAKAMLERKRQTIKEAQEEYKNNPKIKKLVQELKDRNAKRGTPVIRL